MKTIIHIMMYENELDCADGIVINVCIVDRIFEQRSRKSCDTCQRGSTCQFFTAG